jgi:hypothetical protein
LLDGCDGGWVMGPITSVEADRTLSEEKAGEECRLPSELLSGWRIETDFVGVASFAGSPGFPAIGSKTLLKIPIGP